MDYRTMYNAEFIGAWDLEGREVVVTIERVECKVLTSQRGKDKKPVLYFKGKEKGFVANKTNGKAIAMMYGPKTEDWVGKSITLYPTTTSIGNETVDCLRVRPQIPKRGTKSTPAIVQAAGATEEPGEDRE